MDLKTEIQLLHGVGPKLVQRLYKLGIKTVEDLLYFFPRIYNDYTNIVKIGSIGRELADNVTIKARIINIANRRTSRRRFTITEAVVADETGSIKVVWFNQPYLEKMLKAGQELSLNGKVVFDKFSGQLQMESPVKVGILKIAPVYPETIGLNSNFISKLVESSKHLVKDIEEYLPAEVIKKYQLKSIKEAIEHLHFPDSIDQLSKARDRMAFDELFYFSLQKQLAKKDVLVHRAPAMKINEDFLKEFVSSLPFELTKAQKKSAWQIIKDLSEEKPMNRLLNGDVGSGKTVVAAFAAAVVVKNGKRVALMAPTEILANQHFETLKRILEPCGINIALVTSASQRNKKQVQTIQESNDMAIDFYIGTHALLHMKEPIKDLGLVIIDEQHRFGVNQREILLKSKSEGIRPHYLSMTATPIPRTMSLVVFADLDVSVIDEMPKNRRQIITKVISSNEREKAYNFIRKEVKEGNQVFVVCPLIEEKTGETDSMVLFDEDKKTVTKESQRLQKEVFPDLKIGMLHGKMKSKEKDAVMQDFKAKKYDILVSTSVVEVGVDIPNATVMLIENAEAFGLAQLHQFRGRVGRSDKQSYCLLFSSSNSENARKRLSFMESISSGFKLAEMDLELRGPGQMHGYQQSGFWDFRFADIGDRIMIEKATEAAKEIASNIEQYPLVLDKLGDTGKHLE